MPTSSFAIAQVTPYAWGSGHEVNVQVEACAERLAARGHRVTIVAPSHDDELVRRSRRAIHDGGGLADAGSVRVLAVGEAMGPGAAAGGAGGRTRAALPIDVSRTVEELLGGADFDLCHVHEPYAPSVSSAALRHSRALNVGTFHQPQERVMATQVARKLVDLVFGRLDARLASWDATGELMARHFPASYETVRPGALTGPPRAGGPGRVTIAFLDAEERGALRTFLRGVRRLDPAGDWEVVVRSARGTAVAGSPLRAELRDRVRFIDATECTEDVLLARADVVVAASDGAAAAPGMVARAIAAGAVPLAASLAVYEEVTAEGEHGLLFAPDDHETLAAQLDRLVGDAALRDRLRAAAAPAREHASFDRVVDDLEVIYERVTARRHPVDPRPKVAARLAGRPLIDVDLHMHTDHSHDCATPVEVLLATAREQGLGAIAVTDHNEVSGALEAQRLSAQYGVKVIVGEEVKTASQGEVIGLFLTEKIPRGMTLQETVAEIKRQGGVVYVPHPFDRMHAVPDYEHLLAIIDDVDAIEVYNPRVAIGSFNEEAARFAAKYRIVAGAGSDSHVAPGLGSVRIRMPDFDGPEEFIEALRVAEIQTKRSSLLYVQALKFLETKATPAGARKARRDRRVRRATRKG